MKKIKVVIDQSTRKSSKQKLFERMNIISGMPLRTDKSEIREDTITEIDRERFSDLNDECLIPSELVDYLNRVRQNAPLKTKDREKFKPKDPFIHAKSKLFGKDWKETLDVDVDEFKRQISQEPNNLIGTTPKMLKSGNENEFVYKTGIPAFRGIVYDQSNDEFLVINTCPGAGSCVLVCYALKGNYIRFTGAYDNMTRILNFLLNHPDQYKQKLYDQIKKIATKHKAFGGSDNKIIIRWNDSGDFFSKEYVRIAGEVTKQLKDEGFNIDDYAYTKMADVANDDEQVFGSTKFSMGADTRQEKMVDPLKEKSIIVPANLFHDLSLTNGKDLEILKDRIANDQDIQDKSKIAIRRNHILTFKELRNKPEGKTPIWSVITTNKDGDDAGLRKDVQNVLLTIH